jgi:hypothetical protein
MDDDTVVVVLVVEVVNQAWPLERGSRCARWVGLGSGVVRMSPFGDVTRIVCGSVEHHDDVSVKTRSCQSGWYPIGSLTDCNSL